MILVNITDDDKYEGINLGGCELSGETDLCTSLDWLDAMNATD